MPTEGHGIYFDAAARERRDLLEPPANGEHAWVTVATFRLTTEAARRAHRPGGNVPLDGENLASVDTLCFVCEQPYSDRLSYRKCTGEPND